MKVLNIPEALEVISHLMPRIISTFIFPYLSTQLIANYQLKKIKKLINFAYNNIEVYRNKYDAANIKPEDINDIDDFRKLPCITKEEIINGFPDKVLPLRLDLNNSIVSLSSGSSGKAVKVVYGKRALAQYILAGLRTYSMGLMWKPWYKQISIYTSEHPLNRMLKMHWLEFVSTLERTESIVNKLMSGRFDFLSCYPSILKEIKMFMENNKIAPPILKSIFVNSETVSQNELNKFADFFKCSVYDEYSSEELNRIAAQCKYKNYHVFEDLNFIEIVDKEGRPVQKGESGEVIGTNLVNFCMPLIRYKQDDHVLVSEVSKCRCGSNFRIIENIMGRLNDCFILPSGKILPSGLLLDLMYTFLLNNDDEIYDYCIVQEAPNHIIIEIIPGVNFKQSTLDKLQSRFKKQINENLKIEARSVNRLRKTLSGKKNPIICAIKIKGLD